MLANRMLRNRIARYTAAFVNVLAIVIYRPALIDFSKKFGFWYLLPVWVCLFVGGLVIGEWLEKRLDVRRSASLEVHNSNFPRPSVRAFGWNESLIASEASVREAFRNMEGRHHGFIGLVCEDGTELLVRWNRLGWTIESQAAGRKVNSIAVKSGSPWAGKELRIQGYLDAAFKRTPVDWFDDDTAWDVVGSFLGWNEMPADVAWTKVKYG